MKLNKTLFLAALNVTLFSCSGNGNSSKEVDICDCLNSFEERSEKLSKKIKNTADIVDNDLDKKCSELLFKINNASDKEKLKYSAQADECFK